MEFGPLKKGVFVKRVNRFVGEVLVDGKRKKALIRNTGRLEELLTEGREVYLREREGRCEAEVVLVKAKGSFVCIDSHLPPLLLLEYMRSKGTPWFPKSFKMEPKVGSSRFDLLINGRILIETKSVNLVKEGVALFPDAPTERGRRHIRDLIELRDRFLPALVFVIQREDAKVFSPNYGTDPDFGKLLEEFWRLGLPVKAFSCKVSPYEIRVWKEIPVVFNMS